MKKFGTLLFAAVAVLAFTATSCRKDRTCTCTEGGEEVYSFTYPKVTKDEAQTSCDVIKNAYPSADCTVE